MPARRALFLPLLVAAPLLHAATLTGTVSDARTGATIPSRVYIQSDSGQWFFPTSASPDGSAVIYRKNRRKESLEMHTTLSARPFTVDLPAGDYTITAERGKEYRAHTRKVTVADKPIQIH